MLAKSKTFRDERQKMKSTSGKLTGWMTSDRDPVTIPEESDEEDGVAFQDIPAAPGIEIEDEDEQYREVAAADGDEENFLKRAKSVEKKSDDKKKLGFNTSYDGFSIYGKVVCLIVKRRVPKALGITSASSSAGQATMEDWIVSTQMPQEDEDPAG